MDRKRCSAVFLGRKDFAQALELQLAATERRKRGLGHDVLLLLEHPPTVTLGRNGGSTHLRVSREDLAGRGVGCIETDRGGDITFHGPGQLVGYPILELAGAERDVRRYMRALEEALIRTLAWYGVAARREEGITGVWTERGKIAALGVHISRWVTRHGFALNVDTELGFFDLIVPCGLAGRRVTSMAEFLERPPALQAVAEAVAREFGVVLEREVTWISLEELSSELGAAQGSTAVA